LAVNDAEAQCYSECESKAVTNALACNTDANGYRYGDSAACVPHANCYCHPDSHGAI
jgi:hypothetical protein